MDDPRGGGLVELFDGRAKFGFASFRCRRLLASASTLRIRVFNSDFVARFRVRRTRL